MSKKLVVCFEGMDGCGKTTILKYIKKRLNEEYPQLRVVAMDFFGNMLDIGEISKTKAKVNKGDPLTPDVLFALLNDTTYTLYHTVPELLEDNDIVLIDRGRASLYVYQYHNYPHGASYSYTNMMVNMVHYLNEQDKKHGKEPYYVFIRSSLPRCARLLRGREERSSLDNRLLSKLELEPVSIEEDGEPININSGYDTFFHIFHNKKSQDGSKLLTIDADKYRDDEINETAYQLFKEKFSEYLN